MQEATSSSPAAMTGWRIWNLMMTPASGDKEALGAWAAPGAVAGQKLRRLPAGTGVLMGREGEMHLVNAVLVVLAWEHLASWIRRAMELTVG